MKRIVELQLGDTTIYKAVFAGEIMGYYSADELLTTIATSDEEYYEMELYPVTEEERWKYA